MESKRVKVTSFILTLTIALISCVQALPPQRMSTAMGGTASVTASALSVILPGGDEIGTDKLGTPGHPTPEQEPAVDARDVGTPEEVVRDFLDGVSEGDLVKAKSFWKPEVWNPGIEQLVVSWAAGRHEFSIGGVSYAGFVAPGDYRPLEADDPRVLGALVTTSIDGFQGSFALEKTSSGWLITGWLVSDKLQE